MLLPTMSDSQNQTIDRYYSMLHTNALAHCLRSLAGTGVLEQLRHGQKDLETIASSCQLDSSLLQACLDLLVAVGFIEQYGEDFALSQAARLMEGADMQFGESLYGSLPGKLQSRPNAEEPPNYRQLLNTRQWTHTAAAIQAAEVLDIGSSRRGLKVLVLGSGAAVWIGAMAYRDPEMQVTMVDDAETLQKGIATLHSIELKNPIQQIAADYRTWDVPLGEFDLVLLAEVLQLENESNAVILLGRSADALQADGQVVILEPLREVDGPSLPLAAHQLELQLACVGQMRSTQEIQQLLRGAGFGDAQWGWLTASHQGIGLVIAPKQADS